MSAPKYISLEDAGGILGLSTSTIRRYIGSGILPGFKVAGKTIRVREADVLGLVERIPAVVR